MTYQVNGDDDYYENALIYNNMRGIQVVIVIN